MKILIPPKAIKRKPDAGISDPSSVEDATLEQALGQLTPATGSKPKADNESSASDYQFSPGFTVEYHDVGAGPVVILLHAFPMDSRMWRSQVKFLAGAGYRAIAPDLPGWGGTGPTGGAISIESMADDVVRFMDALKLDAKVVLCGLSMGGYIGQVFAHKYGERLRGLVLADTRAEADTPQTRAKRDEMIEFAEVRTINEIADKQRPNVLGETTLARRPEVVKEWDGIVLAQSAPAVVAGTRALRDRADGRAWLGGIKIPTLLIFGDEDKMAPPEIISTLMNGIKNSKVEIIAGAGHMSNMEDAPAFNKSLLNFLAALPKE